MKFTTDPLSWQVKTVSADSECCSSSLRVLQLLSALAASPRQQPWLIYFLQLLVWRIKVSQKQSYFMFLRWDGTLVMLQKLSQVIFLSRDDD